MKRRQARYHVFRTLFSLDVGQGLVDHELAPFQRQTAQGDSEAAYVVETVRGVLEKRQQIDDLIGRFSTDWPVERMSAVDRNLLRAAVYELTERPDIPPAVTISEAVVMAKRYGTAESARFVNGILGAFQREREAARPTTQMPGAAGCGSQERTSPCLPK